MAVGFPPKKLYDTASDASEHSAHSHPAAVLHLDLTPYGSLENMSLKKIALTLLFTLLGWTVRADVGFFSQGGIPDEVARKTQIGVINASTPAQLEKSLMRVSGSAFKLSVDLGPVTNPAADPATLGVRYTTQDGTIRKKTFMPMAHNSLRVIPPDRVLRKLIGPFLDVLAKHAGNVGTIYLVDEPYLNGITKKELERAASVARRELNARGLKDVKIGVIFAAGMFDPQFARMIDKRSGEYVRGIDDYHAQGDPANPSGFQSWTKTIKTHRLATYDRAGNLYVDGGLPQGFDVFGFDFYLSTLLLDSLHEHTLEWLAARFPQYGCGQFAGQPMSKIRSRLSFFHNGVVRQEAQYRLDDRRLLDAIYECRMGALTAMLKNAVRDHRGVQFLMVSESSSNGAFEFDSSGNVKQGQPGLLVESRVFDEVRRAQSFYARNAQTYTAGLMYFTYQNEYDSSIKLHIGGVSTMPSVLASIYAFAAAAPNRR